MSIDRCVVKNRNLIIGDLEKAATVVTAHYDTPKAMPFPFATYLDHFGSPFSQSWDYPGIGHPTVFTGLFVGLFFLGIFCFS